MGSLSADIQLSPEDRLEFYYTALPFLESKQYNFICTALQYAIMKKFNVRVMLQDIESHFPELQPYLPIQDGTERRVLVLKECIAQLTSGLPAQKIVEPKYKYSM